MGALSWANLGASETRRGIATADAILAQHRQSGRLCVCGRLFPCSVAEAVRGRRAGLMRTLRAFAPARGVAIVNQRTVLLPAPRRPHAGD